MNLNTRKKISPIEVSRAWSKTQLHKYRIKVERLEARKQKEIENWTVDDEDLLEMTRAKIPVLRNAQSGKLPYLYRLAQQEFNERMHDVVSTVYESDTNKVRSTPYVKQQLPMLFILERFKDGVEQIYGSKEDVESALEAAEKV